MASTSDSLSALQLYLTPPYACSYVPDLAARSQVVTPLAEVDADIYNTLIQAGFRRSGIYVYRPHCDRCRACTSVRIPVAQFTPNRSQRRTWQRLSGLEVKELPLDFAAEHFALYQRYQAARHPVTEEESLENARQQYAEFLLQSQVNSRLLAFYEEQQLRMVSVVDVVSDGLSAVYTFYDPEPTQAGYGVYNVLWQIRQCQLLGLPYLYLGYYIQDCRKMAYKARFRPLQQLQENKTWAEFLPNFSVTPVNH